MDRIDASMGHMDSTDRLLVGVLSDTHGTLDPRAYAALADCDHIIHAGDVCDPSVLSELRTLAPVTAVLGNNDFDEYGSAVGRFASIELAGVHFLVAHCPQDVKIGPLGCRALAAGDPIPDICIHGHTHVPRLEWGKDARPASYILNPGSTFRPRSGSPRSVAKVAIAGGKVESIVIEGLDGTEVASVGLPVVE